MTSSSAKPGRLALAFGLAVTVLGIVAYAVQLSMQRLWLPWYVPAAATVGVVLVALSLVRGRTVARGLALLLVGLVAAGGWTILVRARLPAYAGPVALDRPFPAFTTTRADGEPFTEKDLKGGPDSVLVFFRGRW